MKRLLAVGLVCLLAGGIVGYCARGSGAAEAEKQEMERLVALRDSALQVADRWRDSASFWKGRQLETDSAAAQDSARRMEEIARLQTQASGLSRRLRVSLDSAETAILDSLETTHASEVAQHEALADTLRSRIRVRDSRIFALTSEVESLRGTVAFQDSALEAAGRAIRKLEAKDIRLFGLDLEASCGVGPTVSYTTDGKVEPGVGAYCGVGV